MFRASVSGWLRSTCKPSRPRNITPGLGVRPISRLYTSQPLTTTSNQRKTIYALSTPPGKGGVAIVRVSGPDAMLVWNTMVRSPQTNGPRPEPVPWKLQRCHIVHPENEGLIDDGLAVYFRAPYSYTTQPTLELHIHSGRALISALLSSLACLPSLRPAEPGEFTRQALLGGRLDLTQVEGLHDLIEADTEVQRVWALGSAGGETRAKYDSLRSQVIHCLAQVEALIDFGEGEDIEEGVYEEARLKASELLSELRAHLADDRRGELVRSGIKMAIFGPPNAGKSSLFNYLANRPASIVTPIPGTTRDVLELTLDIGGLPVVVADTAGLRRTEDVVEGIGVERGMGVVKEADIRLCVLPLPEVLLPGSLPSAISAAEAVPVNIPATTLSLITPDAFFLFNKQDLVERWDSTLVSDSTLSSGQSSPRPSFSYSYHDTVSGEMKHEILSPERTWTASLETGQGMSQFVQGLAAALRTRFDIPSVAGQGKIHAPLITRARHRVHIEAACQFLEAFLALPADGSDIVLAAEELRYAAQAIGRVTGEIGAEDVLDVLFRGFCIGK